MAWYHRLRNTLRSEGLSGELDRELEFHLAERVDELLQLLNMPLGEVRAPILAEDSGDESKRRKAPRGLVAARAVVRGLADPRPDRRASVTDPGAGFLHH